MITVETQDLERKRQIVRSAGYTICRHGEGSHLEGWYALLPGETAFFDNADEAEANPQVPHRQNYLGFFSSEADLLDGVVPLADERLKRHVSLYAVVRVKVCGITGSDKEAIARAAVVANPDRLLTRVMMQRDAEGQATEEVSYVAFGDEFTRFLVDLVDTNGERIEGTESYFEGDVEHPIPMPGGLSTEERATHLLTKIIGAYVEGLNAGPLINEAADLLKGRLPPEDLKAVRAEEAPIAIESFVSDARQQELISLAEQGYVSSALRMGIREALNAGRRGVPAAPATPYVRAPSTTTNSARHAARPRG